MLGWVKVNSRVLLWALLKNPNHMVQYENLSLFTFTLTTKINFMSLSLIFKGSLKVFELNPLFL